MGCGVEWSDGGGGGIHEIRAGMIAGGVVERLDVYNATRESMPGSASFSGIIGVRYLCRENNNPEYITKGPAVAMAWRLSTTHLYSNFHHIHTSNYPGPPSPPKPSYPDPPPNSPTMPRAEAGSLKSLNNKMKAKGLQRLRWYCQVCEKQCRDENGFKCHTQSESHVRQMLVIGEDAKKFIADYSSQFQRDFLQLLRTSHGEKKINANHFYQEYIANKEHVHMNATKWISLTEFVKFLGREGICRVEDGEKGLFVSWVDNSPDALRRQEAIRKKERQDRGDEEREQRAIREQVERARRDAEASGRIGEEDEDAKALKREEGEKIKLAFGGKKESPKPEMKEEAKREEGEETAATTKGPEKVSMQIVPKKPKNVFAAGKRKDGKKDSKESAAPEVPKRPMSEAERIMKEGMERKRLRGGPETGGFKRQRVI